jgi:hypothetical protein
MSGLLFIVYLADQKYIWILPSVARDAAAQPRRAVRNA